MTKAKSTKRSLLFSAISLMLCFAMLIGTTYAWFTDSVTSANNIIKSGNLDVELYYATEYDGANTAWQKVDETTKIFKEGALYEPGYTEVVYFKVENKGSLYLSYNMSLNIYRETPGVNKDGQSFKLSDYLCADVLTTGALAYTSDRSYIYENYSDETLNSFIYGENYRTYVQGWRTAKQLAPGQSYECGMTIFMPTTAGNEINHDGVHVPEIELGINLIATQSTKEVDSFGDDYDFGNGEFMVTPETAQAAIENAAPGSVITLGAGHYDTLVLRNSDGSPKDDITIKGRGGNAFATCSVGAINLNYSSNVTILNVAFDASKAIQAYKCSGNVPVESDCVSSIVGGLGENKTGCRNVVIDNCSFKSTSTPASNYVAIQFEEGGKGSARATDIVVIGCKLDKAAYQFVRMNYMGEGTIYIKNNTIAPQSFLGHNAFNFTGNSANLIITGNTIGLKSGFSNTVFGSWNNEKSAIGTSRQGDHFIKIVVTGNTFINNALTSDGRIVDLKASYTADNCSFLFEGNTYLGGLDGMTDATAPINSPFN